MENREIIYYERLDSTNTKAHELALEGAKHGTVVVADSQTAGKGRRGRSWESPAKENIYMSFLLRPELTTGQAPMVTLVMAYSVAKVLQKKGFANLQIKWPNDLVLSGKKCCGILTEMYLKETQIDHVVVGVGINVNTSQFPAELADKATSLRLECGKQLEKQDIIMDIVDSFAKEYKQFAKEGDLSAIMHDYNSLLINCGNEVRVLEPGNEYMAYALGINSAGELLVRLADGTQKCVFAGEVSVRGVFGYV